jgi:uncharacterized repeat protein (TIGR01451 family)
VKMPRHLGKTHVSAIMAGGLIAMPIALLPGHSVPPPFPSPSPSATAQASASRSAPRAKASPPAVPGLSISVTDGKTAVKPGDQLTYLVSVKDSGTLSARHLKITQTLPAGLELLSATSNGVAAKGQVAWLTSIPAGGAETFKVVTRVTRTPARLLRLAAVACATAQGSARPIVCAAHLDQLPAVAATPAAKASGSLGKVLPAYVGVALAVLVVGALVMVVARRAGRRRQPD